MRLAESGELWTNTWASLQRLFWGALIGEEKKNTETDGATRHQSNWPQDRRIVGHIGNRQE